MAYVTPSSDGQVRAIMFTGGLLSLPSGVGLMVGVLLGLSGWLYFNTTQPGDGLSARAWTIAVGSAGIACLIGRVVVGVQRQLLHRRRGS
ncbi:hypothetical protein AB0H94_34625 [Streptomyces purpurascens]|uniref:hypothetical protein n=1 Tax=Streptomyces purpurascens TaxID=1924 RepID=UPI0033C45520